MAQTAGRNQRCRCGSGRKAKHCCGLQRGPSEADMAAGTLAVEGRRAARRLYGFDEDDVAEIYRAMLDLPRLDSSMLIELPRLFGPELERLRYAIEDADPDAMEAGLPQAVTKCDTPLARLSLLHAARRLRASGQISQAVADAVAFDLSEARSHLVKISVLEAVAVNSGATHTPGGLLVAAG